MDGTWWRQADDLDEDQKRILTVRADGNYLIIGPPGSGKTNILILRGIYLRASGLPNCQVLVFTRTLREFISSGLGASGRFPTNRVSTHAAWSLRLLGELGMKLDLSEQDLSHDESRERRNAALLEAVERAGLSCDYFDSILLDEVQDYWANEVDMLSRLTKRLFVVGDGRQRIYSRNEGIDAAKCAGCEEHKLKFHYRLGHAICLTADRVYQDPGGVPLETYCQYREAEMPSSVERHQLPDIPSQCHRMLEKLRVQLRAYPDEWIGVIAPRKIIRDEVGSVLQESDISSKCKVQREGSMNRSFDQDRPICIMTAHSAKGTEFRAVHLIAADKFRPYFTRELGFTVITRAKTSLDVYHTSDLDGPLEAGLAERRVPDIEELFE